MVIEIAIKIIILGCIIGGLGAAFFMWLNAHNSELDEQTYDEDFDVHTEIDNQYIQRGPEPGEDLEYEAALRAYAMPSKNPRRRKAMPEVKVERGRRPAHDQNQTADYVDAEILDTPKKNSEE